MNRRIHKVLFYGVLLLRIRGLFFRGILLQFRRPAAGEGIIFRYSVVKSIPLHSTTSHGFRLNKRYHPEVNSALSNRFAPSAEMVSDTREAWYPRRSSAARYCYCPLFVARPSCRCLRQTQPFLLFFKLYNFLYGPFLYQKAVMDRRYPFGGLRFPSWHSRLRLQPIPFRP
jgi:hypothetical protein